MTLNFLVVRAKRGTQCSQLVVVQCRKLSLFLKLWFIKVVDNLFICNRALLVECESIRRLFHKYPIPLILDFREETG